MHKDLIEIHLKKLTVHGLSEEENLTDTSLLSSMGWKSDRDGLQVKKPKNKSNYILVRTDYVEFIHKCYHGHTMTNVPDWGPKLVKKPKNWETKGLSSRLVGMTPIVSLRKNILPCLTKKFPNEIHPQ